MALITTPDETVVTFEGRSRIDVFDLAEKKSTTLPDKCFRGDAPSPYGWLETLAWSPDGRNLAFNVVFDGYPAEVVVGRRGDKGWTATLLKRPAGVHVRGYGSPLAWIRNGHLCFLGEEKGARPPLRGRGDAGRGSRATTASAHRETWWLSPSRQPPKAGVVSRS